MYNQINILISCFNNTVVNVFYLKDTLINHNYSTICYKSDINLM